MRRNNFTVECLGYKLKVFRIGETARIRAKTEKDPSKIDVAHTHFTYEVFFVTEGELQLITEDGKTVYERSAVIIPPRISHYSIPNRDGSYCLLFSFEKQGTELEAVIADRITTCSLSEESAFYIRKASEKLDTLSDGAQTDAELLITLLFRELIRELLPTAAADVGRFGVSRHISSIETLINSNLKRGLTLGQIAQKVFLSERQVSRIIAKEYGCSLPRLINDKRMAAAEMLIKNTELPMFRIAEEVGFTNESYFFTLFKAKYGITPLKYRKQKIR